MSHDMDDQRFDLKDVVKTKSGLVGEVIGCAYYLILGWCYRIKIPGRQRTLYRWQNELQKVK